MERLLIIKNKINNPIDSSGAIDLDFYHQDAIPIKFIRAVRLQIETELQGGGNLIKSLIIFIEFNDSVVGGEEPSEVIALGRLNLIKKDYINNFFNYFSEITQRISGTENLVTLVFKEDEDFR
jgi:hypothetical protein